MNRGNEPAMPTPCGHAQITSYQPGAGEYTSTVEICKTGLTIREHFAGLAMQGLLARDNDDMCFENAAYAVQCADALIVALAKEGKV